ncbi:MAG: DUF5829 family protein [Aquaticitalea sp.]
MKHTLTCIVLSMLISTVVCEAQTSKSIAAYPVSDLAHIDVILDSITYYAIRNDPFMQNEFGVVEIDTAYYGGKPSYDLYILGQLNFLHLSLAKGFWDNQQGGGVLVFQTRKPNMKEPLFNSWKAFYKDSLFIHTYKGNEFTLDEVMAWYKTDTLKAKEPNIFANLTSYSADAYHNWGITDSIVDSGLSMKKFMESWGGKELENKLFRSITELHMTINQQEFKEIKSSLLANGYEENKNVFTHSFNPHVYITVNEETGNPKYSKVKFKLIKPVAIREIVFSPSTTLQLNGDVAWFLFK